MSRVLPSRADTLDRIAARHDAAERTPLPPNLGTLLDEAVTRHGDALLWVPVDGGEGFTYRRFGAAVMRCVAALHRLGVRRGTHVGVMLPSVPALGITWMALAKLGAVMVPINTRYTARELDHVLAEGEVALLVVDAAHLALLDRGVEETVRPLPPDRVVTLGAALPGGAGEWQALCDAADAVPALPAVEPDQLMTLQFTSGSTGAPKGCMLTQRYWTTIARTRAQQGPAAPRILIDMPFHYMGGQWRFLMALVTGATAYVAPAPSLTHMMDRLLAHDIAFCSVTPAMAKQPPDDRRGGLRLAWAGTMAMPAELQAPLEERLNGAPVREMYGTTETGAALAMPVAVDWMRGSGSAGLPVPFRRLRIVDGEGREVPDGTAGELLISGPAMMLGYYRRAALNAEILSDGWFHTGDLFRRDGDGFFTMLGRIKDVIRRNGENISATELETVLAGMPEVLEAAAIPVPDAMRGEEVKVCLALRPGLDAAALPPAAVLAFCAARLARFKLPRYLAYLPSLPKTPSGKIAKQALRPPGRDLRLDAYDAVDGLWR